MSQDPEKYLYFSVGLLRGSPALNALLQDALRYHMIDQPGQLIAMRLTEYYELLTSGNVPSMAPISAPPPISTLPPPLDEGVQRERLQHPSSFNSTSREKAESSLVLNGAQKEKAESTLVFNGAQKEKAESTLILNNPGSTNGQSQQSHPSIQETFASPAGAEQNAEEAADYWKLL